MGLFGKLFGSTKSNEDTHVPITDKIPEEKVKVGDVDFFKSINNVGKFIIVDIETTGLPKKRDAHPWDVENWPRIVQIAWIIIDKNADLIGFKNYYCTDCIPIPQKTTHIHGITDDFVKANGVSTMSAITDFMQDLNNAEFIVAHHALFDIPIVESEIYRHGMIRRLTDKTIICTMENGAKIIARDDLVKFGKYYHNTSKVSLPNLVSFLYDGYQITVAHNALFDAAYTASCLARMINMKHSFDPVYFSSSYLSFWEKPIEKPVIYETADDFNQDNPYNNKKIVITGVFQQFSREEIIAYLTVMGASIVKSISSKTDYVLVGSDPGPSKLDKIIEMQSSGSPIKMLNEKHFIKVFTAAKKSK